MLRLFVSAVFSSVARTHEADDWREYKVSGHSYPDEPNVQVPRYKSSVWVDLNEMCHLPMRARILFLVIFLVITIGGILVWVRYVTPYVHFFSVH